MKRLQVFLAASCLVLGFSGSGYASTIWTLQNVHFTDGATATGSFTLNTALDTIIDWDITVSGSVNPPANNGNHHYKMGLPGETYAYFGTGPWVTFANWTVNPNRYLDLMWASPLTNAGGVINLLMGDPSNPPYKGTFDCPGCGVLNSAASISGATVPEPMTFLLVGTGLAALVRRRRQMIV